MDKEWVYLSRVSKEYRDGARKFANMAQANAGNPEKIICPCIRCENRRYQHYNTVYEHLVMKGMDPTYTTWVLHGERPSASIQHEDVEMPETYKMYRDVFVQEDDAVAHVIGDEYRGQVRGLGFRVAPSRVNAQLQQNKAMKKQQDEIDDLKQQVKELRSMLVQKIQQNEGQSGGADEGMMHTPAATGQGHSGGVDG